MPLFPENQVEVFGSQRVLCILVIGGDSDVSPLAFSVARRTPSSE